MLTCEELNELYRNVKERIETLKLEVYLEFQKEKGERDYSRVRVAKEEIENEVEELKYKINPIPELLRGKEGVRVEKLEIGGKTKEQLIQELIGKEIVISNGAKLMMRSKDFTISTKPELIDLIHLKVGDMGFPEDKYPTIDEIYKRIKELGLELCSPEVGPNYRLKYADQQMEEKTIGMKQIESVAGSLELFDVKWGAGHMWLDSTLVKPKKMWYPSDEFVFRVRPPSRKN